MPGIDPRISVQPLDRVHFGMKPELAKAISDATGLEVAAWSRLPQAELVRKLPDRVAWELCTALSRLDGDKVLLSPTKEAAARRRKTPLNAMEGAKSRWWQEKQPHGQRIRPYERLKIDNYRIVYKGPPIQGKPTGTRGGEGRGLQKGRVFGKMAMLENGQPVGYARTPQAALENLRKLEAQEPRVRGYLRVERRSDLHERRGVERGMQAQVERRANPKSTEWIARRVIQAHGYRTVEEAMEDLADDRSHGSDTVSSAALSIWAKMTPGQKADARPAALREYVGRVLRLAARLERPAGRMLSMPTRVRG